MRVPSHLKLSASQKQYWDVKSKFRDVVLFFKVGKFYELYEDDAEIGCAALDWKMTVSGVGHCRQVGCPESGVDAAIAELVRRGHKVGRIEQMETAAEAKARTGSKTAVIRRELLEVTSPATAVDGDGSSRGGQSGVRPAHLMAIAPRRSPREATGTLRPRRRSGSRSWTPPPERCGSGRSPTTRAPSRAEPSHTSRCRRSSRRPPQWRCSCAAAMAAERRRA